MFYRRKVILALLEVLGDPPPTKTDFQNHLFLFTRKQADPAYDFVPHTDGCYSFSAEADHVPMVRKGLLSDDDRWVKRTPATFAGELKKDDLRTLRDHQDKYGSLRGRELIQIVYSEYPYYTIHSEITDDVLGSDRANRIRAEYQRDVKPGLLTIGYEGRSLEGYVNELIRHRISLLVDVRKNPVSRKFGFSKSTLSSVLRSCNIEYRHLPGLGITSSKRSGLKGSADFQKLFEEYRRETLPRQQEALETIAGWVENDVRRVALTCFERDHASCHRDSVAQAISDAESWSHPLRHL